MYEREFVGLVLEKVYAVLEMPSSSSSHSYATTVAVGVAVTAVAGVAVAAAVGGLVYYNEGSFPFKAPWSRRTQRPLIPSKWFDAFEAEEGRLIDDGDSVIYRVRRGGIDPGIRAKVWPFLLGVYGFDSNSAEREAVRFSKREEYEELRQQCCQAYETLSKQTDETLVPSGQEMPLTGDSTSDRQSSDFPDESARVADSPEAEASSSSGGKRDGKTAQGAAVEQGTIKQSDGEGRSRFADRGKQAMEDFSTWQRIIRLDAVRMNAEWVPYSESQANVGDEEAARLAKEVGIVDDEHLEACRRHHAARLVAILEAYALFDPDTGYCQGMSDLLSPFVALMDDDFEAFWCFVKFMQDARHNFRLDEIGIRRQLNLVGSILKASDAQLYDHLCSIRSEDCTFVYRMVVVLMRRELSFEQTLNLWEVIWADWAALDTGRGRGVKRRQRNRLGPPSRDLLLFVIAAAVRRKRRTILGNCRGLDELVRECNGMAGNLDVWELLDDARELVRTVQDKVSK